MQWPKISIKWKIFHWCFSLAIGILAFNYWYTAKLVQRSAGPPRFPIFIMGGIRRFSSSPTKAFDYSNPKRLRPVMFRQSNFGNRRQVHFGRSWMPFRCRIVQLQLRIAQQI